MIIKVHFNSGYVRYYLCQQGDLNLQSSNVHLIAWALPFLILIVITLIDHFTLFGCHYKVCQQKVTLLFPTVPVIPGPTHTNSFCF